MSGRSILGVTAAMFGLLGLTAGVIEWSLHILILGPESGDALYTIAELAWLGHIMGFGLALIMAGAAVALPIATPAPAAAPAPAIPPPIPAAQPQPKPVEETRAAEDLWQSADAPFPAPPHIEHPTAGPSLWQSDSAPFPKVEVPEDEEDEPASRRES